MYKVWMKWFGNINSFQEPWGDTQVPNRQIIVGWLTPKRKQLPSIWSRNGFWLHLGHASGAEPVLSALKRKSFKVLSHDLFRDLKEWPIPFGIEIISIFKIMKAKPPAKGGRFPYEIGMFQLNQWWEEELSGGARKGIDVLHCGEVVCLKTMFSNSFTVGYWKSTHIVFLKRYPRPLGKPWNPLFYVRTAFFLRYKTHTYNFFSGNPWFWVNCNWIHQPEFD